VETLSPRNAHLLWENGAAFCRIEIGCHVIRTHFLQNQLQNTHDSALQTPFLTKVLAPLVAKLRNSGIAIYKLNNVNCVNTSIFISVLSSL